MILVTGGLGYIGSHIVTTLLEENEEVIIVDDASTGKEEVLDRIKEITGKDVIFYKENIEDKKAMDSIFSSHTIDSVIHLAAKIAPAESVENPAKYYRTNTSATIELIDTMINHDVFKIIFSSSAALYGDAEEFPVSEENTISAINPYGRTKIIGEWMIEDMQTAHPKLQAISLRYFNPLGAHKSGLLGNDPKGEVANVFPYILSVAIGKDKVFKVTGDDFDTPDGTGVRDYIHILDLARGHIAALKYLEEKPGFDIINLGTGKGTSVLELIKAFEEATGTEIPYEIAPRRAGDIATSYTTCTKAKELLNWETEYTIEDMCRDGWNWQSKNPDGYDEV